MSHSSDSTVNIPQRPVQCANCGFFASPLEPYCLNCGADLSEQVRPVVLDVPLTSVLKRQPLVVPSASPSETRFTNHMLLILQVLPSAACLTLQLHRPAVLGRGGETGDETLINLSEFNALQHGVSRQHCRFERLDDQLLVRDLGSTNGTYLNDCRLIASEDYLVAHGDRLILGTLHFTLAFSAITG